MLFVSLLTRGMLDRESTIIPSMPIELVFVAEEAPEGGYIARAVGESIFTEADSLEQLNEAVRQAVRCHFDDADRPRVVRLHFVRDELIAV